MLVHCRNITLLLLLVFLQALFYPPMVDEQELPMRLNTDNRSPRTSDVTAVEGAGDGSGMDDDQPSHEVDEEIPVSPAGLLGSVGGSWGRSWVAKAAGPKTERFRVSAWDWCVGAALLIHAAE